MSLAPLLLPAEKTADIVVNADGQRDIILICEHAGKEIPQQLDQLGLNDDDARSHIAWDIGAEAVSRELSRLLNAPLVLQRYSRLVYDCNRSRKAASVIPMSSASIEVPGNQELDDVDREARYEEIYLPFENAVSKQIMSAVQQNWQPFIISIHSFTKHYNGQMRDFDLGILHGADPLLAVQMLEFTDHLADYITRCNEPYGPKDNVTHTIDVHGIANSLPNVMFEIRNDLISDRNGQILWANRLADILTNVKNTLKKTENPRTAIQIGNSSQR